MTVRIATHWFDRKTVADDITLLWEPYVDRVMRCNIWHVRGRERDLLVDTGLGVGSLREAGRDLFDKSLLALATHTHLDHAGGMHEFEHRLVHRLEADELAEPKPLGSLRASDYSESFRSYLAEVGYPMKEELITAYPHEGYDPASYRVEPAAPTWLLDDGDVIDLGNRSFEVLHLPGHSPGSIGLWEVSTGVLFSGDAVYDGALLDRLEGSSISDYIDTMERLRSLPVAVVHGGHEPSFGRDRLHEIIDEYLDYGA